MSLTTKFTTTRLLISDYYDFLINRIDIYTEQLITRYAVEDLLPNEPNKIDLLIICNADTDELCGEKYHQDPYLYGYNYDHVERQLDVEAGVTTVHDYLNQVRSKQIDAIRKVQEYNLDMYEMNKLAYKINPCEGDLQHLKSRLFADKFCFLVEIDCLKDKFQNECIFKLYLVITDFYVIQTDKNSLEFFYRTFDDDNYKILNRLKDIYIDGLVATQKYGFEVISIDKQSLQNIEKFYVAILKSDNEGNLNSDRIRLDMSSTKSLGLYEYGIILRAISLEAFANLEYLSLYFATLTKLCLNGLNKLKKLKLFSCNLSEIKWESLFLGNLLKLKISNRPSQDYGPDYCLDFRNLNRLEWLDLDQFNYMRFRQIKNLSESLIYLKLYFNDSDMEENEFFTYNKMPNLINLNLNFQCNREFRKEWILSWPNLKSLTLEYKTLKDLEFLECESLSNLEDLTLIGNTIIKQDNFSKLVSLKRLYLNLKGQTTSEFPSRLFSNLSNLETFILKNNETRIDKEAFFGLTNLISLDLCDNKIKQLDPTAFVHTPNLTELNLKQNPLIIAIHFFSHLKNLKTISIDRQNLTTEAFEYANSHYLVKY